MSISALTEKCGARSRRGSYIAEAAVVLPIIILAVITVILVIMFFYEESVDKSGLHMALRSQAGEITGHVSSTVSSGEGSISVSRKGVFENISGRMEIRIKAYGLLSSRKEADIQGSWHATDPVGFLRTLP